MPEYNGGYRSYPDRVTKNVFFRAEDRATKTVTIKSGRVLKALSFVESEADGRCVQHSAIATSSIVRFGALTAGQTLILGGLTYTAGASGATKEQVATSFAGIAAGTAAASITWAVGGTFSGTLTGFFTEKYDADSVEFTSSASLTAASAVAATGTGSGTVTISSVTGQTVVRPIAGVLVYDVDATSADVEAQVYTEASFWADALVWAVDPNQESMERIDGTTVAYSAYNTGAFGTSKEANNLKKKFVEGSEFTALGFRTAGENI